MYVVHDMKQGDMIRCRKNLKFPEYGGFLKARLWDDKQKKNTGFLEPRDVAFIVNADSTVSNYIEVITSSGIHAWVLSSMVEIVE